MTVERKFDERMLQFSSRGNRHVGVFNDGGTRWKDVCVLVPGSGPVDVDGHIGPNAYLLEMAHGLAVRGIPSLRFGKRIIGPKVSAVESYADEYLEPLQALIREARRIKLPLSSLVLVGHSLGGHVAPYLAAHLDRPTGIVLLSAHLDDLVTIFRWQLQRLRSDDTTTSEILRLLDAIEAITSPVALNQEHERYLWNARRHDPRSYIKGLNIPVMCVAGEQDAHIPYDQLDAWRSVLYANGLTVWSRRYEKLNHLLMPSAIRSLSNILTLSNLDEELLDDLAAWIYALK